MKTKIKKSRLDIWKHCHIGIVDLFFISIWFFSFYGQSLFSFSFFFYFSIIFMNSPSRHWRTWTGNGTKILWEIFSWMSVILNVLFDCRLRERKQLPALPTTVTPARVTLFRRASKEWLSWERLASNVNTSPKGRNLSWTSACPSSMKVCSTSHR